MLCRLFLLLITALMLHATPVWAQTAPFSCDGLSITWSLQAYNVYLQNSPTATPTMVATVPAGPEPIWSWPCPTAEGIYYLSISAVDMQGREGQRSFPLVAFTIGSPPPPPPPAPMPPSGLVAASTLTWINPSPDVATFIEIHRKPEACALSALAFAFLSRLDAPVATGSDAAVQSGMTYCYRIRAGNPSGVSDWSNTAERVIEAVFEPGARVLVTTLPRQLLNVRATANGAIIGTQPKDARGTILAGPEFVAGVNWFKIDYDAGTDGFSSSVYLLPIPKGL